MKLVKQGKKELCKAFYIQDRNTLYAMLLIFLICKVYKYKMKKE